MILVSGRIQERPKSQRMNYDLTEQVLLSKVVSQDLAGCSEADVRYRRSSKREVLIRRLRFICSKSYHCIDDDLGISVTSIRGIIRMLGLFESRYGCWFRSRFGRPMQGGSRIRLGSYSYPLPLFEFSKDAKIY